jgi:hypothetical protein
MLGYAETVRSDRTGLGEKDLLMGYRPRNITTKSQRVVRVKEEATAKVHDSIVFKKDFFFFN